MSYNTADALTLTDAIATLRKTYGRVQLARYSCTMVDIDEEIARVSALNDDEAAYIVNGHEIFVLRGILIDVEPLYSVVIDDASIRALRSEAEQAGDDLLVRYCDRALLCCGHDMRKVAEAIAAARPSSLTQDSVS